MVSISCRRSNNRALLITPCIFTLLFIFVRAQDNPICFICFDGLFPNNLDAVATDPITLQPATCADLQSRGEAGLYTTSQCQTIQTTSFFTCDCTNIAPSAPVPAPQQPAVPTVSTVSPQPAILTTFSPKPAAPSVSPRPVEPTVNTVSPQPTAPTVVSTVSPKPAATFSPRPITPSPPPNEQTTTSAPSAPTLSPTSNAPVVRGSLTIVLRDLPGEMQLNNIAAYENQANQFFTAQLANAHPPVTEINSTLLEQNLLATNSTDTEFRPLQTLLRVTGRRDATGSNDLDILLQDTVNSNSEQFVAYLRNATPPINQIYFSSVQRVDALSASVTTPAPSGGPAVGGDPAAATKQGLSSGAIAGIVIAALAVLLLIGGAFAYLSKQPDTSDVARVDNDIDEEENKRVRPEATLAAPAAAAAVAAAPPVAPRKSSVSSSAKPDTKPPVRSSLNELPPKNVPTHPPTTVPRPDPVPGTAVATPGASVTKPNVPNLPPPPPPAPLPKPIIKQEPNTTASTTTAPVSEVTTAAAAAAAANDGAGTKKRQSRPVIAPPGKLGIVIDTTLEGPVVHKVNAGSPLEGIVFPGDVIISIDNVDTRAMSASAITSLMVKTANQQRHLVVMSDEKGSQ